MSVYIVSTIRTISIKNSSPQSSIPSRQNSRDYVKPNDCCYPPRQNYSLSTLNRFDDFLISIRFTTIILFLDFLHMLSVKSFLKSSLFDGIR